MASFKKIFIGDIENGKVNWNNPANFIDHMKSMEGMKISVTVDKYRKTRSNNQNRYYHGTVLTMMSEETGYTNDECHALLTHELLKDPNSDHRLPPRIKSTSELDTKEFEDYMSKCRMYISDNLELYVPEPNEDPNLYQ